MSPVTFDTDAEVVVVNDENADENGVLHVPENRGFMMWLHPDSEVSIENPLDKHYPFIHPNCYAPADLADVYLMHGGGSGTAVFHGRSEQLGPIVMKHGGARDSREVFSLVTIRKELIRRGALHPFAAEHMRARIPEFVMVYLSPFHVRNRSNELWTTLRNSAVNEDPLNPLSKTQRMLSMRGNSNNISISSQHGNEKEYQRQRRKSLVALKDVKVSRRMDIVSLPVDESMDLEVHFSSVDFFLPGLDANRKLRGGAESLQLLGIKLIDALENNSWKVTLAQKQIGGDSAENGAHVLTSGKLEGDILDILVVGFTQVMRNLQLLTLPDERGTVDAARHEVETLMINGDDPTQVSKLLNQFAGNAILKNYKPESGRLAKLRSIGDVFRSADLNADFCLSHDEVVPARLLGRILQPGACPGDVFCQSPSRQTALDIIEDKWLDLLEHAVSFDELSITDRVWTCGLADAGLHNTFLSLDRGLELFDLGEPMLVPLPAFLTKFLMSFFHSLGMEDEEDDSSDWVVRFHMIDERASLTCETTAKIPYVYQAYCSASDHFIAEFFEQNHSVRQLLVKYVVLQLLSDASFCLERWENKGGGTERYGVRAYESIAKWLWRSLWDIYIASHVYANLLDESLMPEDDNATRQNDSKSPIYHSLRGWSENLIPSFYQHSSQESLASLSQISLNSLTVNKSATRLQAHSGSKDN